MFGLNQQAYNTALMNATQTLPASGECRLDWVNQNYFQLHMMRRRRIDVNKDYNLAAEYMSQYTHNTHPHTNTDTHTHTHKHTNTNTHTHTHTHTHTNKPVHTHAHTHKHKHTHTHAHIHKHTHTHI